jgi:YD repeat-containing protein
MVANSFTNDLSRQSYIGGFGQGGRHNYDIKLTGNFTQGGAGRVVMPDEGQGRLFSYLRTETDGTHIFNTTATITQLGDVVRKLTNGTMEYRRVSGEVMKFDSNGKLQAMVDRNGNTTTLAYGTNGKLSSVTDAVGRSITLEYNSNGYVTRVTDPIGRVWQYGYTGIRLTSVTDPLGKTIQYMFNPDRTLGRDN